MANTPAQVLPSHIRGFSYGRTYFRAWESQSAILILKDSSSSAFPGCSAAPGEVLLSTTGHSLSQLLLRMPDHSQDLNEACVCRAVLF